MSVHSNQIKLVLSGGLGNQLFQYAACRALALRKQASLLIDLRFFDSSYEDQKCEYRPCLIDKLPLSAEFKYNQGDHSLSSRVSRKIETFYKGHYTNTKLGFDSSFKRLKTPIVVSALLQSHKYFLEEWGAIKTDLKIGIWLDDISEPLLDAITSDNSVAIHVRRGDYLQHSELYIGDLARYYQKSIASIYYRVPDPAFFIFSDDISWCMENIANHCNNPTFVDFEDARTRPERDFALMARCKHHIIANSTFSWWAAFLGMHDAQIVYAPERWTRSLKARDIDLVPERWEVIGFE